MAFREDCEFLDVSSQQDYEVEEVTKSGEKQKRIVSWHPCLSEENELTWVDDCPSDCPYFKKKN